MYSYTKAQKIYKILSIALPSGANSFLDILNISVGMYFMGILGSAYLVSLGLSMSFIMLLFTLTAVFFIGTNAQISRYFGAKDLGSANDVLGSVSIGAVLFSLPLFLIAYSLVESYFSFMLGDIADREKIIELGKIYLSITLFALPALLLRSTLSSSLSAIGQTRPIFYVKAVVSVLNIILNYLLIFGNEALNIPKLDIYGAGITNLVVTICETLGLFCFLKKGRLGLRFRFCFYIKYIKDMLRIGIPAGIERCFTLFSLVLITKFMGSYSTEVIAGFQVGQRVENFILMPGFGFQVASMALVGQNLGAGRERSADEFIKLILFLSCVMMGILGVLICIFGVELSSIFSDDKDILGYSWHYLIAVGLSQIPLIAIFVLDGALRGSGATKLSLLINASSIWLIRILPMSMCVYFHVAVEWIFFIIFLETYIRACIFIVIFKKGIWKKYIARF